MIAANDQPGTVHLVGAPPARPVTSHDAGRVTPAALCAACLRRGDYPLGPVVVVGGPGAHEHAVACGLSPARVVVPPLERPDLARWSLRRIAGGADRVVCWSDELARVGSRLCDNVELVSTDPGACRARPRKLARIACLTERDAEAWRGLGGTPEVIPVPRRLLPDPDDRVAAVLPADAQGRIVFTPLSDRPTEADARGLAFLLSLLHETGYPVCGVIPVASANLVAARRHHRALHGRFRLLVSDRPLPDLLGCVDVAVMPDGVRHGADTLLEAMAAERGVEIVRLAHRGRAGLKSTPGVAAPILQRLDAIMAARQGATRNTPEPAHA